MILETFATYDDNRTARRARKALAHAIARRAQAETAKAQQRCDRAARHGRRAYLEALTLADLES